VPMMVVVAVVVPEHPPVVCPADDGVDVREAVLDDLPIQVVPDFFLQNCSTPRPLSNGSYRRRPCEPAVRRFASSPNLRVAQEGRMVTHLLHENPPWPGRRAPTKCEPLYQDGFKRKTVHCKSGNRRREPCQFSKSQSRRIRGGDRHL
jgi:hypothetical protein